MGDWTGYLRLAVHHKNEKTMPREVYHQGAFKITPPIYLDDSGHPCFYLLNPGGGYVDGDRYRAEISLDRRAQMLMTTQSSTKIYKTLNNPVIQETEIRMEEFSYLEYIPDPIIAYQYARYQQSTNIHMKPGAALVYGEIITPGWSPDGTPFTYHKLQLKTSIYVEDEMILFDHLQLRPSQRSMDGMGILDGYSHLGSLIIIGDKTAPEFVDRLYESISLAEFNVKLGLSVLTVPGISLRVLANSTQEIETIFAMCVQLVRKEWFDKKRIPLRKY